MKTVRLRTPFEVGATPLSEYPRPQFARNSYVTLNGEWDYAILRKSEKFGGKYQGKIGINAVFLLSDTKRTIFPRIEFHTVKIKSSLSR